MKCLRVAGWGGRDERRVIRGQETGRRGERKGDGGRESDEGGHAWKRDKKYCWGGGWV
jgi:hypothetical protein